MVNGIDPAAAVLPIAAAALGGLAVGVERQWSGHASGPTSHFGGMRTFTLLGGLAGLAGWLWTQGATLPAAVLLAGCAGMVIAGYVAASRRDIDGTTEVAALVVLAAGFVAGLGGLALASGIVATTLLALVEKSRLHALVRSLNDAEMRAGARFAVMAVVILPLLPEGPYGPFGGVRPRRLWMLVLLFAGIGFAGYIARRAVGRRHGYALAGLLGGVVSSTQVTLAFARASRGAQELGRSLACGAVAASTVMFARTLFAAAVLEPRLAGALLPYVVPAFAVGVLIAAGMLRQQPVPSEAVAPLENPLQVRGAVQMALLFQAVLMLVHVARARLGGIGLLVSAGVIGLTDVDAVTVSMLRAIADGMGVGLAATAIAVGMLSNTLLKLALAVAIGRGRFRSATGAGLAALAVALAATLFVLR